MNTKSRNLDDIDTLRAALNAYNSCVRAADGFVSGNRVENLKDAERRLRVLLWRHREALIDAVTALPVARRYIEPHPSWESEQRQREALEVIHSAVGPSDEWLAACPDCKKARRNAETNI